MLFLPSKARISFAVNNNYNISQQPLAKNLKNWNKRTFLIRKSWPASVGFSPTGGWNSMERPPGHRMKGLSISFPEAAEEARSCCEGRAEELCQKMGPGVSGPPLWWQGVKPGPQTHSKQGQAAPHTCREPRSWGRLCRASTEIYSVGSKGVRLERGPWLQLTECLRTLAQREHVNPILKCRSALTVLFNQAEMTYQKMGDDCG